MARRPQLTEAERAILEAVLAGHPHASERQVILIFKAKTGRVLHHSTVAARRAAPYKGASPRGRLTEAERDLLRMLVAEDGGEAGCHEIARQFAALAGRPLSAQSAWRALRAADVPGPGKGWRPSARPDQVDRKVADASAAKRARGKLSKGPGRSVTTAPTGRSRTARKDDP